MLAHIAKDGREQSLCQHLEGVGQRAGERGRLLGAEALITLAGRLHDLGKGPKFQDYLRRASRGERVIRGSVDHSTAGAQWLHQLVPANKWEEAAAELASLLILHHHGLADSLSLRGEDQLARRLEKEVEWTEPPPLDGLLARAGRELETLMGRIGALAKAMGGPDGRTAHFLMGFLHRMLLSMLVDADWSNTAAFEGGPAPEPEADFEAFARRVEARLQSFRGEGPLDRVRRELSDACFAFAQRSEGGIYALGLPTGSGKTDTSLRAAVELARRLGKKRILYAAPYISILEQNAEVYRKVLGEAAVLEHHSNLVLGEDDGARRLMESWSAPVIATTMVRLLNVLFGDGLQDVRRLHRLADSVIILDEVQSLPVRAVNLVNTALNFLARVCGASVILCSATQPRLGDTARPILYGAPRDMAKWDGEPFRRCQLTDRRKAGGYDSGELAALMAERMEGADSLLAVVNTKGAALKLYEALAGRPRDFEVFYLTTNLCPAHRLRVLDEVKEKLGRRRLAVVSTQLIEAGVDISFAGVIRSLAGLDSLVQAAGRCNRNGDGPLGEVSLVNFREENLAALPEIRAGRQAAVDTLDQDLKGRALDDPGVLEAFYRRYFYARRGEMDYPVELELPTTLYELLSYNGPGRSAYRAQTGRDFDRLMGQAFGAAKAFRVIESDTVGVIVPYGEGRRLTERLRHGSPAGAKGLLREAQRYTVNLYRGADFQRLIERNALEPLLEGRVYALREGFYDDRLGVTARLSEMIF